MEDQTPNLSPIVPDVRQILTWPTHTDNEKGKKPPMTSVQSNHKVTTEDDGEPKGAQRGKERPVIKPDRYDGKGPWEPLYQKL